MDAAVTTEAERLAGLAASLAERAGASPADPKAFTDALLALMRSDGLLSVCVGPEHGGPGLSLAETARITFEIARQDGSAGLIHAMHMSQAASVAAHGTGPFFDRIRERMVAEGMLFASGTSEKGPQGDILSSICSVEPLDGGRGRIVKESPNISYIDHADAILVSANGTDAKGRPRQVLALAEVDRDGFEGGREGSFMGMRGILNRPWRFTVEFPGEAVFHEPFGVIARGTMTPVIHVLWAALWSGLARAALDRARRFAAEELAAEAPTTGIVRHELTRLMGKHQMMNALIREAISAYEARAEARDMGFGLAARINRLKIECADLVVEICRGAMELIGIRAYAAGGPYTLAAILSDALSAPIMVSNYRLAMNTAEIDPYVEEGL